MAHLDGGQGPSPALEGQLQSKGHVQDDLPVSGLGRLLGLDDVLATHVADVTSNVDKAKGGDLHVVCCTHVRVNACMRLGVRNEMGTQHLG